MHCCAASKHECDVLHRLRNYIDRRGRRDDHRLMTDRIARV